MNDDIDPSQNPIVAMAQRIRARRDIAAAVDGVALPNGIPGDAASGDDTAASLGAFGAVLAVGAKRLNVILGRSAMRYVRLERPLRLRLRFDDRRITLDLDEARALVLVNGCGFDGEYQFDASGGEPGLINLSKLSTEAGYGDVVRPNAMLKEIAKDAELPRPDQMNSLGPFGRGI